MRLVGVLGIVTAVVLVLAPAGSAAGAGNKGVAALQKKEAAATKSCADKLRKAAKSLAAAKAFEEARAELRLAIAVAPTQTKARKELGKLLAKAGETPETVADKVEKIVVDAHAACAATLAPVLEAWGKAERPEELARLATTAVAAFGESDAFGTLELAWYEPRVAWARKADIDRWERGDEFHDGAWIEAEKLEEFDAAHAEWSSPWVIGDGVHEIRTTMPLGTAKRVGTYVSAFRKFVIGFLADEWPWKASRAPLPIYLTATQADYQARLTEYDPGAGGSKASAVYVQRTGGLCPVFVTFEPNIHDTVTKIGWDALLRDVRHEVAHQILYESAMAQGAGVGGNIDWVSEGIANYLAAHRPRKGKWKLARLESEPYGNGFEPGSFAWVKGNFGSVAKLSKYLADAKPNLDSAYDYFIATTLNYFLLEGVERRYRSSMMKLIVEVHMAKGSSKSFGNAFGKVDLDEMQEQWREFVAGIRLTQK